MGVARLSRAPVNVAQLARRSPLRCPGGRTRLMPQARGWIEGPPAVPMKTGHHVIAHELLLVTRGG